MSRRLHAAWVLAALLGACSFAPPYHVPASAPAPPGYQEEDTAWKTAQPADSQAKGPWWTMYQNERLDALEEEAQRANQNLKAAFARLQQARADTRIARADFFPTLSVNAAATRERISPNSPTYVQGKPTQGNDFNLEADLGYEADLWGRVRNQVAAQRASQQASAADLAAIGLSIQAEIASDYFNLRSDDARQQLLNKTVEDYTRSLNLTETLFEGGAAAISDVAQAKAQLFNALTQLTDVRLQRAQLQHAIAVLVGENPSTFSLPEDPLPGSAAPPPLDPGMPSDLLERRPDVAEAERRVASANAQIGVARAAYFPQLSLVASGGVNSLRSSTLIGAPSLFWSLGPQVSLPIFEGGRLLAQTARAKAAYEEQVADYRNTVLSAYQDVEDNLVALRRLEQESATQAQAVEAANVALNQSQNRYTAGIVTYLEVATNETSALQAQLSSIDISARRLNASVLLIKALGGGWQRSADLGNNP